MLSKRTLEQELGGFGHTKVQFLNSAGEERKKGISNAGAGRRREADKALGIRSWPGKRGEKETPAKRFLRRGFRK